MNANESAPCVFGLGEVVSQTTVKCMCRTYRAIRTSPDQITFSDITDITRPEALGSAEHTADVWEIRSVRGDQILCTDELIRAVVQLRQHTHDVPRSLRPPAHEAVENISYYSG